MATSEVQQVIRKIGNQSRQSQGNGNVSNSGTNPGTGVLGASKNTATGTRSTSRGRSLKSNQINGSTTELAQQTYLKNKTRKPVSKASARDEKQRNYLDSLIKRGIIQAFTKDKSIKDFVKENLDKVKSAYAHQGTVNAEGAHTMTCKLLDVSEFDKRKALLKDRNQQAIRMLKPETINEVKENQWNQSKENNIYSLYETFVKDIGYFIDFGRLDPKTFKERTGKVVIPLWAGLRAFAERYSKANVRYPGLLLYIMNQQKQKGQNKLDLIIFTKRLLSGQYHRAIRPSEKGTFQPGLASSLKSRMLQVDQKLNDAFDFTNKLVSIVTTLNELSKITVRMADNESSYTDSFKLAKPAVGQLCTLLSDDRTKRLIPASLQMTDIQSIIDKEKESKETVEVNNDTLVENINGLGNDGN